MLNWLTACWWRWRWVGPPAAMLILFLQRTPALRPALVQTWERLPRIVVVLQGIWLGAMTADEVHAQTGATALSPGPGEEGNPGQAQVGVPFQTALAIIGAALNSESYEVRGEIPPGLRVRGLTGDVVNSIAVVITGTPTQAGEYTIFLRAWAMMNKQGDGGESQYDYSITVAEADEIVTPVVPPPVIISSPQSRNVAAGDDVALRVRASAVSDLTYQWWRYRSGEDEPTALAGQTSATLSLTRVSAADMGFYFARVTADGESADSAAAIITLPGAAARLTNLSTRGILSPGGSLTPGFVLRGTGAKPLIIRAVGPQLAEFMVAGALADPQMEIIPLGSAEVLLLNDNWGDGDNAPALPESSARVGAFPLADPDSLDAAVLTDLPVVNATGGNGYTVRISSTDPLAGGIALAEVYDLDGADAPAQLANVSALGHSGDGDDVLSPGFVIAGDGAMTMLIRVVGPTLALPRFGVPRTMTDPRLSVLPSGQTFAIAANDNWGGTMELKAAFATTGAFALPNDDSRDAAVLVRLPPGGYTVVSEGADGGTGTILVEAYEVVE